MELLETVALSDAVLRRKTFTFVERSSENVVDELSSAKQIVIKLCQVSLSLYVRTWRRLDESISNTIFAWMILASLEVGENVEDKSNLPDELKHPVILTGGNQLVRLLAQHYHRKFRHQGYRVVIANLR